MLANQGFDVWILNNRGNYYGRNHTFLDSSYFNEQFWNFSFHEIGIYDIPGAFKYIKDYTNNTENQNSKIDLIGHSLGGTNIMVSLCES